jgi:menaquinone-dependent protoporphyrinogen oxidase
MKKVLLLFASREGQTRKIATRIAEHLEEAGLDVDLVDAADRAATEAIDLESYALLVFGASLHAGGIAGDVKGFVHAHARQIQPHPKSFFLVSLSAATKDPEIRGEFLADARRKLDRQIDVTFEDTEMLAGALRYSKYPLPLKWLMRRIASEAGEETETSRDYEYTDWEQVERYAARLATLVRGPDAP